MLVVIAVLTTSLVKSVVTGDRPGSSRYDLGKVHEKSRDHYLAGDLGSGSESGPGHRDNCEKRPVWTILHWSMDFVVTIRGS